MDLVTFTEDILNENCIFCGVLTAEKNYSINFTGSRKEFCLSLHYTGSNSYLFANGAEIIKLKAKESEINATPLCLGKISKDFSVDNMKKTGLNEYVYDLCVDYDAIAVDDILDIHKCLMKKSNKIIIFNKIMFGFIEKYVCCSHWIYWIEYKCNSIEMCFNE